MSFFGMVSSRDLLDRLLVTSILGNQKLTLNRLVKRCYLKFLPAEWKPRKNYKVWVPVHIFSPTSFFKVTFWYPKIKWRSLKPSKRHIFFPKNQVMTWRSWNLEGLAFLKKTILFFRVGLGFFLMIIPPNMNECLLKRDYLNRKYIVQPLIFRGHVRFRGSSRHFCCGTQRDAHNFPAQTVGFHVWKSHDFSKVFRKISWLWRPLMGKKHLVVSTRWKFQSGSFTQVGLKITHVWNQHLDHVS